MDAHIVHDWHDYQFAGETEKNQSLLQGFLHLSYMTLQLEGMQSSTNFSLDANTSLTQLHMFYWTDAVILKQ